MNRTRQARAVARELLTQPNSARWSYELAKAVGLTRGSVNRILNRMVQVHWLVTYWEHSEDLGPRRRYYTVTEHGLPKLVEFTADNSDNGTEADDGGEANAHTVPLAS